MVKSPYSFALSFAFLLLFSGNIRAQTPPISASDTLDLVRFAYFPAASFNSDLGFIGGFVFNRFDMSTRQSPYTNFTAVNFAASTEGLFLVSIEYDQPNFRKPRHRGSVTLDIARFTNDNFFGIGRQAELDTSPSDNPNLFEFKNFKAVFEAKYRFPIVHTANNRMIEGMAKLEFNYETPFDNSASRFISQQPPRGADGGFTNLLSAGIIIERRDHELRPTKGTFLSVVSGVSIEPLITEYTFTSSRLDFRFYHPIFGNDRLVFANMISAKTVTGNAPYWMLSDLGGSENLRGYDSRRFLDDSYIATNTELRAWVMHFRPLGARLGLNGFFDSGRTFSNDKFDKALKNLKHTFGFGGIMSIFTPDFIIRADVGFADEGTGVYISTGYLF